MCTDIGNNPAPAGATQATISPKLFKRWMTLINPSMRIDEGNPNQVVAMLKEIPAIVNGNIEIRPNWHLTAMTDRAGFRCNNFHFKIEVTKAAAHFWHYVLYYHSGNRTWHWVGDTGNIANRNDAGGGAAGDVQLLNANRALVDSVAALHGLTDKVTIARQDVMLTYLKKLSDDGSIVERKGVWQ